jgi:hypothetical protein
MFTAALGALTRFWGGDQNVPFPLQGDLASNELFWALADVSTPTSSWFTAAPPPTSRASP